MLQKTVFSLLFIFTYQAQADFSKDPKQPNLIVIVSDDQRYDQIDAEIMPNLNKELIEKGTYFKKGYVTSPACCPSRAAILTGKYNSKNKVYGNQYPLGKEQVTFSRILKDAGYFTGHIGKFLNSWKGQPRPEYDYWVCNKGAVAGYVNPTLNVNGQFKDFKGHIHHVLKKQIIEFLDQAKASKKPFMLYFAPNTPHRPALPPKTTHSLFTDYKFKPTPNFNIVPKGMPNYLINHRLLKKKKIIKSIEKFSLNQIRSLYSLDRDVIGELFNYLHANDLFGSTAIIYISDNGVFHGEYGLINKDKVYQAAINVPYIFRYDPLTKGKQIKDPLVANIDIAPTLLDLANVQPRADMDGLSLANLYKSPNAAWRDYILVESWGNRDKKPNNKFYALHTGRYVLVKNDGDKSEFYDLEQDPYQLNNRYEDLALKALIADYESKLEKQVIAVRGNLSFVIK